MQKRGHHLAAEAAVGFQVTIARGLRQAMLDQRDVLARQIERGHRQRTVVEQPAGGCERRLPRLMRGMRAAPTKHR